MVIGSLLHIFWDVHQNSGLNRKTPVLMGRSFAQGQRSKAKARKNNMRCSRTKDMRKRAETDEPRRTASASKRKAPRITGPNNVAPKEDVSPGDKKPISGSQDKRHDINGERASNGHARRLPRRHFHAELVAWRSTHIVFAHPPTRAGAPSS
ncbi:hypothetical protein C8R44DRAFT_787897 [Mycena epipterygia]|nr:hypothetical protein C8R44DRAFT_787897 [Mycena epipterygia]